MKTFDCDTTRDRLDAGLARELDGRDAAAFAAHLAACPGCAAEAGRARQATALLDAVRGDELLEGVDEVRFDQIRTRAMARIRTEAAESAPIGRWAIWSWLSAGTVAAVALLAVLAPLPSGPDGGGGSAGAVSRAAVVAPAPVAEDVNVVSVASRDGVTLRWDTAGSSFLVLKSSRPSSFDDAEVTVVCGSSWTDRSPAHGVAFYRVVRSRGDC